jgi:hypothetical protein
MRLDAEEHDGERVATGERSVSLAKIARYYRAHLAIRANRR